MKKNYFLLHIAFLLASLSSFSQIVVSFTATPGNQCFNGNNTAVVTAASNFTGTNSYSWTISTSGTCTPTFTNSAANGSVINISYPCCGSYTIDCTAYINSTVAAVTASVTNVYCTPNVSVSALPASSGCAGNAFTLIPSGATTYTIAPPVAITGGSAIVIPTVSTCYTITGTSAQGCIGTAVKCLTLIPNPTITIASANLNVCSGSSLNLSASGAASYTWIPGLVTGPNLIASPLSSTCYTVIGMSVSGCTNTAQTCVTVSPNPTITISTPTNMICSGQSANITASGASTYTWSTLSTVSTILVNLLSNSCFSVVGASPGGCTAMAQTCYTVLPTPTITLASNSNTVCAGSQVTLTAGGANTYAWSNSSVGSSIFITPLTSICYSVIGTNLSGCNALAQTCITVLNSPTLSANSSNISNTLCAGSSITFTASGASTYTWNTSPLVVSSTINILPNSTAFYTVTGTDSNGCTDTTVVGVFPNTLCAIVWPGDANSDGVVDNTDVFELGLWASSTGAARSTTSNAWTGQFASTWNGTVSSGANRCHADCNGDGLINASDNAAISANFSLTHSFRGSASSANNDIKLVPQYNVAYGGIWNKADIILGDATNPLNQIYGVALELNYDKTQIQTDSVKIIYTASFLNSGNQNIDFGKTIFNTGKLYGATVRTNQANVNGNGKIAEFWYKLKSGLPETTMVPLSVSNGIMVGNSAQTSTLGSEPPLSLHIDNNLVGLDQLSGIENYIHVYPNPANTSLTLYNDLGVKTNYRLLDITGRLIKSGEFDAQATLDISALESGNYIVEFKSGNKKLWKKLLVE